MADFFKGLFGGQKPVTTPAGDDDFADFAGAPDPSPASISLDTAQPVSAQGAAPTGIRPVVYTKWYRVWERTQPSDFIAEAFVLPFIIFVVGLHVWGRRSNRSKARAWVNAYAPELQKEYASVGFGNPQSSATSEEAPTAPTVIDDMLKEKTAAEYLVYATGRQNVAFLDIKIQLYKRYNPATLLAESLLGFLFDAIRTPEEKMIAIAYAFDGREGELVPAKNQTQLDAILSQGKSKSSVYDPFVWAVVHKEYMKPLRDDRYDLSLTVTKDHAKLPSFVSVMSESAEITEQLVSTDLIKAIEAAGDVFEYLIITDQPLERPQSLEDTKPKKRVSLSLKIPSDTSVSSFAPTFAIFNYYLHLPDLLVSGARFRPEVRRKIQTTREEEQRKLKKADEDEKAEERRTESERKKKELRDNKLKGMSAEDQRKFLEKERERSGKKAEKKMMRKA